MKLRQILEKFYQVNVDLYRELRDQSRIHRQIREVDVRSLYDRVHREAAPCFVLSTGRCGTRLLTDILQESDQLRPQHVPTPELTYYSSFAYKNAREKPELVSSIIDSARYEQIRDAWVLGKKYVETNNRITFFCHALADLFPGSNFIHLVRKPEEFITSGLARNWYSGTVLHDEGRIAPEDNQVSQAEKIAWLWNETNGFIEAFKETCPEERVLTIRAEELFHSVDTTFRIFDFLDINPVAESVIRNKISRPVNQQDKSRVPKDRVTGQLLEQWTPLRSRYFT
ncbi:sulfotransferase [Halalkalibaculum sp. DA3122]|uniref:sulfotransferase n=1 Tax=unclassified Halalkalibaculum TaxID=2964617 RepID=UPI0037548501